LLEHFLTWLQSRVVHTRARPKAGHEDEAFVTSSQFGGTNKLVCTIAWSLRILGVHDFVSTLVRKEYRDKIGFSCHVLSTIDSV